MQKIYYFLFLAVFLFNTLPASFASPSQIPNELIDTPAFLRDVNNAQKLRLKHRISEEQFINMMHKPNTIVLDARSPERFNQMHIAGAKHLNFADFTTDALKTIIADKDTRILIYCNNNIKNAEIAFPSKAPSAALNLSTYTSLYSYGYRNIFELGPVIDPTNSKLSFEGSLAK